MASQEVRQSPGDKPGFFYGYIVVGAAFLAMLVSFGVFMAFGVFLNPLLSEFGWTTAMASGAVSLSMIMQGLLGIAAGTLSDRFGPRIVVTVCGLLLGLGYLLTSQVNTIWQFYLFYGVIVGIGMAGFFVPLLSTVAKWFSRRRSAMTGVVVAGVGVGGLIGSPVANYLISIYGWRTSYFILGIAVMVGVVLAAQFLRREPKQKGLEPYGHNAIQEYGFKAGTKSLSIKEAIYTRQFWLIVAMIFCFGFVLFSVRIHVAAHAAELDFLPATGAAILAVISGASVLGYFMLGSAADRIGNRQVFIISFILMAAALFWLIPAMVEWKLYLFAVVFGFAIGGDGLESPLVAEFFGLESHGLIFGVVGALGFTIGGAVGPLVAGYIFDVTGSYQIAFLVCAVVAIAGLILAAALRPISERSSEIK